MFALNDFNYKNSRANVIECHWNVIHWTQNSFNIFKTIISFQIPTYKKDEYLSKRFPQLVINKAMKGGATITLKKDIVILYPHTFRYKYEWNVYISQME